MRGSKARSASPSPCGDLGDRRFPLPKGEREIEEEY